MKQSNIQDVTLPMYLAQELGVEIIYPKEEKFMDWDEALRPGSSWGDFSFQVPSNLREDRIIATIAEYFKKVDPNVRMGETGGIDNDAFWMFQHKGVEDGQSVLISGIRCTLKYSSRTFWVN